MESEKQSYKEYIRSDEWKEKRRQRLEFAKNRCELCFRESALDVHHRTYECLGDERLSDLIVLCRTCHRHFHHRLSLHAPDPQNYYSSKEAPEEISDDSAAHSIKEMLEELEKVHGEKQALTGVPSGFPRLDKFTSGWQPFGLHVIASRPAMGRTSFVLSCATNAAMHPKTPATVGFFSTEMPTDQVAQRIMLSEAHVNAQKARTGRMSDRDWQRLARATSKFSEANIYLRTEPRLRTDELREEARAMRRRHSMDLLIIDSLEGIDLKDADGNWRKYELAGIVRELKSLAMELQIPILTTTSLQRSVEQRSGDKRPQLGDLPSDTGAIEAQADTVLFIYRPERYGITVDENGNSTEGIAEIIIGKQRNGPVGTVELAFVEQFGRFENLRTHSEDLNTPQTSSLDDAPF